jgi:histidine triad (HIT) family protein
MECLFCKIVQGAIPASIIYRNDNIVAFDDINPHAPQHKLIVPTKHIATLNDLQPIDSQLIANMILTAKNIASELKMADDGYRLVLNCNRGGGQTVFHIHLHLLGGRALQWPPG